MAVTPRHPEASKRSLNASTSVPDELATVLHGLARGREQARARAYPRRRVWRSIPRPPCADASRALEMRQALAGSRRAGLPNIQPSGERTSNHIAVGDLVVSRGIELISATRIVQSERRGRTSNVFPDPEFTPGAQVEIFRNRTGRRRGRRRFEMWRRRPTDGEAARACRRRSSAGSCDREERVDECLHAATGPRRSGFARRRAAQSRLERFRLPKLIRREEVADHPPGRLVFRSRFQSHEQGLRGSTPAIPQNQKPNQTASRITSAPIHLEAASDRQRLHHLTLEQMER